MTRRRGKAQRTIDLIDAASEILEEIRPASVRAVCYRLFTQGVIESMVKSKTNGVSRQLTWAREEGIIPWHWIVDETRQTEKSPSWDDPKEYMKAVRRSYRRDYWMHQPTKLIILSEKSTIKGTLSPILYDYGIGFLSLHGFSSATAAHDLANENGHHGDFVGLYVGDWDPSGLYMSEVDLPRRLEKYGGNVELIRVALTREDLADLPSFNADTKRGDTRWRWYRSRYGSRCWELDAMSPPVLRDLVGEHIRDYIDQEAWERCAKAEAAEQNSLKTVLDAWANSGKPRNTRNPKGR